MKIPVSLIAQSHVCRDSILFSDIFRNIDHPKFFVVIGVDDEYVAGFFYINSTINKLVNTKTEQLQMQYLICKQDYPFLSHDSYICATNIIKIPVKILADSIADGKTQLKDTLKPEHLTELLSKLRASRLFSKIDKEKFFM